jgi:hypothetical protein
VHTFSRIEIESDEFTISFLDSDWLREKIASGSIEIPHDTLGPGDVLLTANTAELQQFMKSIANDTSAFIPTQLTRSSIPIDSI